MPPADNASHSSPRSSSKTVHELGGSQTRTPRSSLRGGASTIAPHNKTERTRATKSAKPYDKKMRAGATGSAATATTSNKQKVVLKTQASTTKKKNVGTGKENRTGQDPGTRRRPKPKALDAVESAIVPSSDTLIAPSSPSKPKIEEDAHICALGLKKGAYNRPPHIARLSSPLPPSSPLPLPPSSPPPAISTPAVSLPPDPKIFPELAPVRKSRRLLGLRAPPAPRDAPPELKTRFRSRSSSVASRGESLVHVDRDTGENSDESDDPKDLEGVRDGGLPRTERSDEVLRLPNDMIREDGYAERDAWFDWKKAEYARPWDAPVDVYDQIESALAPQLSPTGSWTPTVSFLSSIAYSRSPCTTLSALFWECKVAKETDYRTPCAECVEYGESDARDCEGGDTAGRRPRRDHTSMAMDVDTDVDAEAKELEDAPWCVNGTRVRYDGSVVGVCRVCTVLGVLETATLGDDRGVGDSLGSAV